MVLGMSLSAFTMLHVALSLIGIVTGLIVMFALLGSRRKPGWTAAFLLSTILTSATGFLFPFTKLLPSHMVGIVSLVLLAVAVIALYLFRLAGPWRWIYGLAAMISLYLNIFVLIIQGFLKVGALKALAPTQTEPPFLVVQGLTLAFFVVVLIGVARRFRPVPALA